MPAFLGDAGVMHDPSHNRLPACHGGRQLDTHRRPHGLVAPGSLGHRVMQGLAGGLDAVWVQASGHGFHGLALAGQQQATAAVFQRFLSVPMPRGLGQALQVGSEALLLRAWPGMGGSPRRIPP